MSSSQYLNPEVMEAIDPVAFQAQQPYPWTNPQYFIRPERYAELLANMPPIEQFRPFFGKQRKHGQASHVCRLLDVSHVRFRFHWHFTPDGGEVSPHCDSKGKIGSQIFYLNTENDWQWDWGGETVVLDDNGRFPAESAPSFEDFDAEYPAETRDNRSLIFGRQGNSWHGVRRINCPENHYRKVFIVVFEEHRPLRMLTKQARRLVTGKQLITDKERLMY
jgi:hypothetical protein